MKSEAIYNRHQQQGMSIFGLLLIIAVAVFIGLFAIKTAPHYMDNWAVVKVIEDLEANPTALKQPPKKIMDLINQGYRQNNLWDLTAEETVTLKRGPDRVYQVTVSYERRSTLFSNIDVVTKFGE